MDKFFLGAVDLRSAKQNDTSMNIINAKDYNRIPWNNGAGFTCDIAISTADEPFWRLSLAEMPTAAPFSLFPKLSRILTVVQGHGLTLVSDNSTIDAPFETPVAFSGDLPVVGHLKDGPVQNYNLVFDNTRFQADVVVKDANQSPIQNGDIIAIFLLLGQIELNGDTAIAGDTLFARNETTKLEFSQNARAVFTTLTKIAP